MLFVGYIQSCEVCLSNDVMLLSMATGDVSEGVMGIYGTRLGPQIPETPVVQSTHGHNQQQIRIQLSREAFDIVYCRGL